MTGRGRPRKPNAQKRREGTYRPDRDDQLTLPVDFPLPPPMLTDETGNSQLGAWRKRALEHWDRLLDAHQDTNLLTRIDGDALALLCLALVEYEEADRMVALHGLTVVSEKGGVYQHPAVGIRSTAWKKVLRMCREFGMTPSARAGMKAGADGEEEDVLSKMFAELAKG